MNQYKNPKWWTADHESTWERTKAAFKRDWDQTKHDMGGAEPDTDQDVNNTVRQASGKEGIPPRGEPTYDEAEAAFRFGLGARSSYGNKYSQLDEEAERRLREDWKGMYPNRTNNWNEDLESIRYGWDYEE